MNAHELAAILNGREYGNEITREEEVIAKAAGLVVAFGYSDDNLELRGAINEEVSAWNGQRVHLTKEGLLYNNCDAGDRCPYHEKAKESAVPLDLVWNDKGPIPWTFKAPFPHATFDVMEEGQVFCRGIVFALADVAHPEGADHE